MSASKVPAARGLLGCVLVHSVHLLYSHVAGGRSTSRNLFIKLCTNPRQKALIPYPNDLTRVLAPRTASHRKSVFQCRNFEETQTFVPE